MAGLVLFVQDLVTGKPAKDIGVEFSIAAPDGSLLVEFEGTTGDDGCARTFINPCSPPGIQSCRALFRTGDYFEGKTGSLTFPEICVEFLWDIQQDMVLPVLINPHSYTTYRGR